MSSSSSSTAFYHNLDEEAKNVIDSDFHAGLVHIRMKNKQVYSHRIKSRAIFYSNTGKTLFTVKDTIAHSWGKLGVTFLSSNELLLGVSIVEKLCPNVTQKIRLKINNCDITSSYLSMENSYNDQNMAVNVDMKFKETLPRINLATVFGWHGYFAGIQAAAHLQQGFLHRLDGVVGYKTDTFSFTGRINQWANTFQATVWQRLSSFLEYAICLNLPHFLTNPADVRPDGAGDASASTPGSSQFHATLATRVNLSQWLHPDRGEIDTNLCSFLSAQYSTYVTNPVSLAVSVPIHENVRMTMSSDMNLKEFWFGNNVGLSFDVEL